MQQVREAEFLEKMKDEEFDGTLHIFSDNAIDHKLYAIEGWRSYTMFGRYMNHPRAAGVNVGLSATSPFKGLHVDLSPCPKNNTCDTFFCNRLVIDESIHEIIDLIKIHHYRTVVAEDVLEIPGAGEDVMQYITEKLDEIVRSLN